MRVIGFLSNISPSPIARPLAAFREGLKQAGYIESQNVAIEYRWAEGRNDRLPELAADLVQRQGRRDRCDRRRAPPSQGFLPTHIIKSASIPVEFSGARNRPIFRSYNRPNSSWSSISRPGRPTLPRFASKGAIRMQVRLAGGGRIRTSHQNQNALFDVWWSQLLPAGRHPVGTGMSGTNVAKALAWTSWTGG
jgi:hypothetical protein